MSKCKYPPRPECSDDLMPEDLLDAIIAWEYECYEIKIKQLRSQLKARDKTIEDLKRQMEAMSKFHCKWCGKHKAYESKWEQKNG